MTPTSHKSQLIILGGGFGGYRLAMSIATEHYDVTIVSPRDHFLFTPLLASTTVGTIEFRSIIEPLRTVQQGIRFYQAACETLDVTAQTITCRPSAAEAERFTLHYDVLVLAVGAAPQTFGIPGAEEHALLVKELRDARRVRQHIISCVERAGLPGVGEEERKRLLHFTVVGGGPTGVEFSGELHDFITDDLGRIFPELKNLFRITLVEASDTLLTAFNRSLGQYAQRTLRKRKINVRTSSSVKEISPNGVLLSDGSAITSATVIWSAGVGPNSFIRALPFTKDRLGRIVTDETLQVAGVKGVYAIGDCGAVAERHYPMTAQLAQQEGKYLARAFNRLASGKAPEKFRFMNLGMLAYIGGHRALADVPGVKWRGFFAWLLWRSVYITKLVSLKNKIRVLFDWVKTSLFGRDITTF